MKRVAVPVLLVAAVLGFIYLGFPSSRSTLTSGNSGSSSVSTFDSGAVIPEAEVVPEASEASFPAAASGLRGLPRPVDEGQTAVVSASGDLSLPAVPAEVLAGVLNLPSTLDFWIEFLSHYRLSTKPDLDYVIRGSIGFPFRGLPEGNRAWLEPKKVGEVDIGYRLFFQGTLSGNSFHGGFYREGVEAQLNFLFQDGKTSEMDVVIGLPTDPERNADLQIEEEGPIPVGYILKYFPETGFKNCWTMVTVSGVPRNANEFPPSGSCGGNLDIDSAKLRRLEGQFHALIKEIR